MDERRIGREKIEICPDHEIPDKISWFYAPSKDSFSAGDSPNRRPWWSVLEALAWIASRSHDLVSHIGKIERAELSPVEPIAALGQLLLITSQTFCECGSQDTSGDIYRDPACDCKHPGSCPHYEYHGPETFWRDCSCLGKASRALFEGICSREIKAIAKAGKAQMGSEAFTLLESDSKLSAVFS